MKSRIKVITLAVSDLEGLLRSTAMGWVCRQKALSARNSRTAR